MNNIHHIWIPAANLRQTYLSLITWGGAFAEAMAEAIPGSAHVLEHLIYAQNRISGYPLESSSSRTYRITTHL